MSLRIGYFAKNLRAARISAGLTQEGLAEKLCYSSKSISKWESGSVLPPTVIILELVDILKTDLNSMFSSFEEPIYYLGVDGGGTFTEFVLIDKENNILKQCNLGPCNVLNLNKEQIDKVLKDGVDEACADIPHSRISAFFGLAGAGSGKVAVLTEVLKKYGFANVACGTDAQNTVSVGLKGEDGIIAILGTGSAVFSSKNGELERIGGYGHLFSDYGSGYEIGRMAICAVLAQFDKSGPETLLTRLFEEKDNNKNIFSMLPRFYQNGKSYVASYAPLVFKAYEMGDEVAKSIISYNITMLSNQINTALKRFDDNAVIPLVLSGGITVREDIIVPMLKEKIVNKNIEILILREKPVMGAVRLARLLNGD